MRSRGPSSMSQGRGASVATAAASQSTVRRRAPGHAASGAADVVPVVRGTLAHHAPLARTAVGRAQLRSVGPRTFQDWYRTRAQLSFLEAVQSVFGNAGTDLLMWEVEDDPPNAASHDDRDVVARKAAVFAAAGIVQTLLDRCRKSPQDEAALLSVLPPPRERRQSPSDATALLTAMSPDDFTFVAIPWLAVIERLDAYLAATVADPPQSYAAYWEPRFHAEHARRARAKRSSV